MSAGLIVDGQSLVLTDKTGEALVSIPLRYSHAVYAGLHRIYSQRGTPTADVYEFIKDPSVSDEKINAGGVPLSFALLSHAFDLCLRPPRFGVTTPALWRQLHDRVTHWDHNLPGRYFDQGYDTVRLGSAEVVASTYLEAGTMLLCDADNQCVMRITGISE